jgi:hypothetical protein
VSIGKKLADIVKLFSIYGREKTKRGTPAHLAGSSTWFAANYSKTG